MDDRSSAPALLELSRSFGRHAASEKKRRLRAVMDHPPRAASDWVRLQSCVCFLLAYPDDEEVHELAYDLGARLRLWELGDRAVRLVNSGLPGTCVRDQLSFPIARRLSELHPGAVEIDWDELEDDTQLQLVLGLWVSGAERHGLDDISMTTREWFARCRSDADRSDLDLLLSLFEQSGLGFLERDHIFESCALPMRYALCEPGTARSELYWPRESICFQHEPIDREIVPIEREIRRGPQPSSVLGRREARTVIDVALQALCVRNLEIRPMTYASVDDVRIVDLGGGLEVAFLGCIPSYREVLEISFSFLVFKNGIPIGYGPVSVYFGCCEMGINLFPEYRGAEIRYLYPQFMRAIHHLFGAEYFYLTSYGMGEGNPDAIRSGAFWFYRKIGFRASDPDIEELAQAEEARMRAEPGYRSSRQMLRRLSHTEAHLDLSGGKCRKLDLGTVGVRQSRFIASEFGGDRRRAEESCIRRLRRDAGFDDRSWPEDAQLALRLAAPLWAMLAEEEGWSHRDLSGLARLIKAKGGRSEASADRLMRKHPRIESSLRRLAERDMD